MGYTPAGHADGGSYSFHFPDGNASIARLLVRSLIPRAVPGYNAEHATERRGRLFASGPDLHHQLQAQHARLLEHDDLVYLSAIAGAAEGGAALICSRCRWSTHMWR
jgi:hypothetical protein